MAEFSIKIFEFALLVYGPEGLTVLSPSHGHALSLIANNGDKFAIAAGATIVLADQNGRPLPPARTTITNHRVFIFGMEEAVDPLQIHLKPSMLNGAVPPELNARTTLSGGSVTELDCSFGPVTWVFENGLRRPVSDQVMFTHPIGDTETLNLLINDTAVPIRAGHRLTLANEDALGSVGSFIELSEFTALCDLTTLPNAAPPVNIRDKDRLRKMGSLRVFEPSATYRLGSDFVCAVGQIDHP
jgi:hypothetical protein